MNIIFYRFFHLTMKMVHAVLYMNENTALISLVLIYHLKGSERKTE